jgi:hypothetical protein
VREDALMMKPVTTFATLLMALMQAAAYPYRRLRLCNARPGT